MVPRIVFTDVDGTLLDRNHHVRPRTAEVTRELARRGIPFVLVSARMPEALHPVQDDLGISGPLVCYGGAYVLDEDGGELLSRTIGLARAGEVGRMVASELPDVCCSAYGFHVWACSDRSDPRIAHEEQVVHTTAVAATLEAAFDERGVHKFLLMGRPDQVLAAERLLGAACPDLTVVRSSDTLCEVMSGGVSKAEGIRRVCGCHGIALEDAVAFGDGCNDVGMLAAVPQSYAMANGAPEARAAAAHVTELDNDHDGLATQLSVLLEGPRKRRGL